MSLAQFEEGRLFSSFQGGRRREEVLGTMLAFTPAVWKRNLLECIGVYVVG